MATKSKFTDVELPEKSLVDYLFGECLDYLGKAAYIDAATGRTHTFGKLKDGIFACAGALRQRGFKPKEVALIYSSNNIDYPMAFLGVVKAGGVVNLCSPLYDTAKLLKHMKDVEPVVIFAEMCNVAFAKEAAREYGHIRDIIIFDGERENCISFESLLQDAPPANLTNIPEDVVNDIDDVCVLITSSGTTGLPKAIQYSHRTFTAGIAIHSQPSFSMFKQPGDVGLCVLPLCHTIGMCVYMGVSIRTCATVVVLKQFVPDSFLMAITDYNVSSVFLVPPMVELLATDPLVNNYNINSIQRIYSAGGPLSLKVMDKVKTRLHFNEFLLSYGMTETFGTTITETENMVEGTVGYLLPNNEIRIISPDTGNMCDINVNGEILICGPQIMQGYHKNPQLTAQIIGTDGWLHTGDFGHVDEKGKLFVVDRMKDLIKYKDYQVIPSELESLLLCHEAVQDVAVIGVPDPVAGELPHAFVVLLPGIAESADMATQLETYVTKRMPPQKHLRGGVSFMASLPRSMSGKIQRFALKTQYMEGTANTNTK